MTAITQADALMQLRQHPWLEQSRATLLQPLMNASGWEGRYRELMRLGKELPALPATLLAQAEPIQGCESAVNWVYGLAEDQRFYCWLDGDARIIKGLLAILLLQVNGQPLAQLQSWDGAEDFAALQLERHLSPSRGNGLRLIRQRIQAAISELSQPS
ncbi:SufE family protein [Balneatrix alpica]|uniref:SufE family protein n=1 Tax=Balneatrix alpica TaxID=75684 RepID=UPI002738278B|nr:SufE family protein [Balneatrix alpica]